MISLRGKLTRTLVERKPPEPKITRSTVAINATTIPPPPHHPPPTLEAPAGAGVLAATTTTANTIDATIATTGNVAATGMNNGTAPLTNTTATTVASTLTTAVETPLQLQKAPSESTTTATSNSIELVEEWTWRGVWAFGDLPKEEQKISVDNIACDTDINATSTTANLGTDGNPLSPQPTKKVKKTPGRKKKTPTNNNPAKPRPFTYRWLKAVDADGVIVPSSLIVMAREEEDGEGETEKAVGVGDDAGDKVGAAAADDADDAVGTAIAGDVIVKNAVENAEGTAERKEEKTALSSQPIKKGNSGNMNEKLGEIAVADTATTAGDAVMGEATEEATNKTSQQVGDVKEGDGDAVMKDAETGSKPSIQADGESKGALSKTDATSSVTIATQPTATAVQTEATTTPKTPTYNPTTTKTNQSKMKTFGEQPFSEASKLHPQTCPSSGKWEGHFENVVPNNTSKKKRKSGGRSADNRIREMFYLFFNATPPQDAKEVFVDSDSTIKANGMLDGDRSSAAADTDKAVDKAADTNDADKAAADKTVAATDTNVDKTTVNANAVEEEAPNQQPLLPKSHIHVRGYGTNRFGTFEIVGSFNPLTGTLQCQRMYVPVPSAEQIAKVTGTNSNSNGNGDTNNRRSTSGRFLSGLDLTIPGEDEDSSGRPRRTRSVGRKRKSTWKKRELDSSGGGFEEFRVGVDGALVLGNAGGSIGGAGGMIGILQGGGGVGGSGTIDIASIVKKRSRLSVESVGNPRLPSTTGSGGIGGGSSSLKPTPQCRGGGSLDSSPKIHIPPATGSTLTNGGGATKPSASPRATPSASGKKIKKKKGPKGPNQQQQPGTALQSMSAYKGPIMPHVVAPPVVSIIPTLPTAGDPFLARWRAAHYLYYQRVEQEPEGDGGQGSSSWGASNHHAAASGNHPSSSSGAAGSSVGGQYPNLVKINVVVYEGEMHDGVRQGRGICLYNNNTLYEGQWKRNKEHGTGTLMTADRKRIIYKGAWEKGKMHGHGAYYYYQDVVPASSSSGSNTKALPPKENGKYIGQFRQNLRNGHGVYTLPDGSIYDGEFRDNIQNGYGVFRWVDNSIYEGPWRDGKRHGAHGILVASDGFRYEGSWQNSSMEGRGVATYPKGQIYDGTWVQGKREGRGTIRFTNGAVYEGRFKDDYMEGQGTMKMNRNVIIPKLASGEANQSGNSEEAAASDGGKVDDVKHDWMIPLQFQSDISHIHQKAGFTQIGL